MAMTAEPKNQRCHAHSSQTGQPCRAWAVRGKTVCIAHGGAKGIGRPPIHGRYSKALANHPEVLEAYERHKADPALGETLNEIALLRAKFERYLDKFGGVVHPDVEQEVRNYAAEISKAVERRHKMLYGEQITLTERDFQTLVTVVVDIVRQVYGGSDERFGQFTARLREVVGARGTG